MRLPLSFRTESAGSDFVRSDMLYLVVQSAAERFAIEAIRVVEVIPLVKVHPLPGSVAPVAGIIRYQEMAVPVLDLNQLIAPGRASSARMSARILLFHHPDCPAQLQGLKVDKVATTLQAEPASFNQPAPGPWVRSDWVMGLRMDATGMLLALDIERLLRAGSPGPARLESGTSIPSWTAPTSKSF